MQKTVSKIRSSFRNVAAVTVVVFCIGPAIGQESESNDGARFPVVVLEGNANFSIPNAATQPAAMRERVAPQPFLPKEIYQRTAKPILEATDLISEGVDRSVLAITNGDERIALGTVVSIHGHVLTKKSLLDNVAEEQIRFRCGESIWSGRLVAGDDQNDVALYELQAQENQPGETLRPIELNSVEPLKVGKIVISVGTEKSKSLSVGMTTAPPLLRHIEKDCDTCIDMGLAFDAKMKLTRVYPRTVGERLGMLVGDELIYVNRKPVNSQSQYEQIEKEIQVGDLISITYRRNGKAYEVADKVPALTRASKRDRWGGGPFSRRRSGFSDVLVHDSVIEPVDCGGPLLGLDGQFCGINIARSMRVATFAMPAKTVKSFLLRYLDETDLVTE